MKPLKSISVQLSDLLVFLLIPYVSLLLPATVSRALVVRASGWCWLLARDAEESLARAAEYTAIAGQAEWKRRWRLVVMLEARDLALLMWGRRSAVFGEIEGAEQIERARDCVLVGMHWGPSIAILSLLQSRGLGPLLVYRPVQRDIFRQRPWYYLFLTRSVRYIRNTCGGRAITIRGAGQRLREELARPGASVVVLDAPPAPGRSTMVGTVVGQTVHFNAGFPEILEASGRPYCHYAISLEAGLTGLRRLELEGPLAMESRSEFMRRYCARLDAHLRADSAQWRIWSAAGQFFVGQGQRTGTQVAGG